MTERRLRGQSLDGSMTSPDHVDLPSLIGEPLQRALDGIEVPLYLVAGDGAVRWANAAAAQLFVDGAALGLGSADIDDGVEARKVVATAADGRRVQLRVYTAPIRAGDRTIAAFALAVPVSGPGVAPTGPPLTARQTEVLHLLAQGLSTEALAERLDISTETARNHIRAVLQRLDAHSRLEAVVEAGRRGLLADSR